MTTLPEAETLRPMWVFGYGSLIWNPEFPVAERRIATAQGFRRAFCMLSVHHRGTEQDPGLVLALDHDAEAAHPPCTGVAFRVAPGAEAQTLQALRDRELISSAYREELAELTLDCGNRLTALAYVIDRAHRQYVGALTLEEQAQIIARAVGGRGPNTEYLYNTADHLAQLGIADADLAWLAARVRDLT